MIAISWASKIGPDLNFSSMFCIDRRATASKLVGSFILMIKRGHLAQGLGEVTLLDLQAFPLGRD